MQACRRCVLKKISNQGNPAFCTACHRSRVAALLAGIRHAAFRMRNHDAVAMLRCAQSPAHALRDRCTIDERSCRTALDP
jgi:hypothetical protein